MQTRTQRDNKIWQKGYKGETIMKTVNKRVVKSLCESCKNSCKQPETAKVQKCPDYREEMKDEKKDK